MCREEFIYVMKDWVQTPATYAWSILLSACSMPHAEAGHAKHLRQGAGVDNTIDLQARKSALI